ncbi:acyl-CoA dehydrogenase domain protein [Acidimicrobium ferrooxidans DSM 10331]|uniref:Acyl-CoA dehydrogenase domain protein n=1 Tax=Acidimicrobium ferrooxidans (strain DSM 10331 / JCM 15462 / NBRC 103882 / ICP) TaxID=525909 RepID=C7LZ09_ACIFD|nr:acyl-CoA dehydrogenase family protein [Acidimicrobium ferrooxidans]ACU53967.1 acyl-CoA dehydrogenase domain protein [Acidimicrobium ferrooxidans DSM 10331]
MRFTEEHDVFRRSVRGVLEREVLPHLEEWERAHSFPGHTVFKALGAAGLLGLEYDPAYGGQGADHSYTVIFGEELGRMGFGALAMAISVVTDMATPSLARYGSHELKLHYLVPTLRGDSIASVAVSEPDAGSDVAALRTRAVRDGDDWVITGTKLYITNGTQADWICLLARTSDEGGYRGMSQIVVPTDAPGFRVARALDKLGNHASDTAELVLEECRVPVSNTIGTIGRGFQQQMAQFQNERMIASYSAVGAMERALERTAAYARERMVFGEPLLAKQYVQFRLAELSAEVDLLRHYNYACAEAYMAGEDTTRFATIAKLTAGRLSRAVADWCLQLHGGAGYMEETWVSRYFRDARLLSIGGGADEVMLQILTRLEGYEP